MQAFQRKRLAADARMFLSGPTRCAPCVSGCKSTRLRHAAIRLQGSPPVSTGRQLQVVKAQSSLKGMNIPWHQYGADFGRVVWPTGPIRNWALVGPGSSKDAYSKAFRELRTAVNEANPNDTAVARFWVFGDGRAGLQWHAKDKNLVVGIDDEFLVDFEELCDIAETAKVKLLPVLWDFQAAFDPSTNGSGTTSQKGHADLFAQKAYANAFITNALSVLLQRASDHRNAIVAWDIINEPEWILSGMRFPSVVPHKPVERKAMQFFVAQCAAAIHKANFKATLGSAELRFNWENRTDPNFPNTGDPIFPGEKGACALWSDAALQAVSPHTVGAFLDMYQVHFYQGNGKGLFDPSKNPLSQYVSSGKPVLVGEIGASESHVGIGTDILNNGFSGYLFWSQLPDGFEPQDVDFKGRMANVYETGKVNKFHTVASSSHDPQHAADGSADNHTTQ